MSCLSLKFPRANKKTWWKSLTSKIQTKLHKLNKPKSITKHKSSSSKHNSKPKRFFLVEPKRFQYHNHYQLKRRRFVLLPLIKRRIRNSASRITTSTAPVYVDNLFKETASTISVKHVHHSSEIDEIQCSPVAVAPGTSKEGGGVDDVDVVWESMGFASPLMHGIDERAEQFIAKFRANMEVQEQLLARDDHL
ncbi:hypothetical protein CsatA_014819 [Cannabis sativa]